MAEHCSGWCVELQATSSVLSIITGLMVTAMASVVDMTFWAWMGRWNWFLSWWLYKAVCCTVDVMVCDVKEREGCTGKTGRGREGGRHVDDWRGSGERMSIHSCTWVLLPCQSESRLLQMMVSCPFSSLKNICFMFIYPCTLWFSASESSVNALVNYSFYTEM